MKITHNGRTIEIVRRQHVDFAPVRKSAVKRNRLGSNQYKTKGRSRLARVRAAKTQRPNWHKTLFVSTVLLIVFILIGYGAKVVWEVKVHPALQSFASGFNQPETFVSPLPEVNVMALPKAIVSPVPSIQNLKEKRVEKIHAYLEDNNSPLAGYAAEIVALADQYDIPWTLVTAISGKESSYGKNIPDGSFNAWGVMAWDANGNRYVRSFGSWEDGIEFETKLLSSSYRGDMNSAIQARYCPSDECSDTWTKDVTSFQEAIND